MINELTVVIRSVGEVTTELCYKQIEKIVNSSDIFVVENVTPFWQAVRTSYQFGIDNSKKWTLIIDADVLVQPAKIKRLIHESNKLLFFHKNIFCINGVLYDKALMMPRIVGAHLYYTENLDKAMQYVKRGEMELRPETYVKICMGEIGYKTYANNIIIGVHDFYQCPRDLLRKGFLHRKKHIEYDEIMERWKKLSLQDKDYFWLSEGARMAEQIEDFPGVDSKIINSYFKEYKDERENISRDNKEVEFVLGQYTEKNEKVEWSKYLGPDDFVEKIRKMTFRR